MSSGSFRCRFTGCLRRGAELPFQDALSCFGRKQPRQHIWNIGQCAASSASARLWQQIEKSGALNSTGALLVCPGNMICSCLKDIFIDFMHTHARMLNHVRLSPCNYTNLMPHSPLLIPNSAHILVPVLNEGAATCSAPNKRRLDLFLIWGGLGGCWSRGGSCTGIFGP